MNNLRSAWEYLRLPGIISLVCLAFSWAAITTLISGLPLVAIPLAVVAFFLDCLDGYVARRTNQASEFGRQLDGTIDFLNYSVFAALLFWLQIMPNFSGAVIGFIILATGAFRLIRFNIEGFVEKNGALYYAGIVVCHITLATSVLYYIQQFYPYITGIIAAPIIIVLSLAQASRILIKKTNFYKVWLGMAGVLLSFSVGMLVYSN